MKVSHHSSHLGLSVIMMPNNEAMYPRSLFTSRARAGGEKETRGDMPHVEQCDLGLFPSNIPKQEQTAQSNFNFLFTFTLDLQDMFAHESRLNNYLEVYFYNTP